MNIFYGTIKTRTRVYSAFGLTDSEVVNILINLWKENNKLGIEKLSLDKFIKLIQLSNGTLGKGTSKLIKKI